VNRACIVYNRFARNAPAMSQLQSAADSAPDGWQVEIYVTDGPRHATQLAREAAERGADAVFACGGDGTINEVVNGLAGTPAALGVIRGGMGDVFGREIGLSRRPGESLNAQLTGNRRAFDVGLINDRRFLLMAGVGIDADIVRAVPDAWKRRLGSTSYALWAVQRLFRFRTPEVDLNIDGAPLNGPFGWLLVGNTRSYGGIARITRDALVDDGFLDAYLFMGSGLRWIAATAVKLALRRHHGATGVSFHRLRELRIDTPGLPVQADGEYVGETPVTFSVEPRALDVLLPAGAASDLFSPTDAA
jgi:diacylglycerol kinase (ATP)